MFNTATAPSCACPSAAPSESTTPPRHCSRHASDIPVSMRHANDDSHTFVNANAPQCCHCGWRGAHAPSCPFR
ncbi:hypothetical protein JVU11DRAFT_10952 [Chiua virens]|nr:hypothetical protein JVU11DRAFT_10952 [Chiua virens]